MKANPDGISARRDLWLFRGTTASMDSMTAVRRGSVRREAGVDVAVPGLQAVHQIDRLAQPQASQPLYCLLSAARSAVSAPVTAARV